MNYTDLAGIYLEGSSKHWNRQDSRSLVKFRTGHLPNTNLESYLLLEPQVANCSQTSGDNTKVKDRSWHT
jgi:hypothetical protein